MKKLFALLLAMMMIFSLAACGDNETPSGSGGDNPGTSQTDNQGGSENQGGEENKGGKELYDVTDAQITVADGLDISVIPAVAKKGIGTLKSGGYDLKLPSSTFSDMYKAQCEITYFDVSEDDFNTLLDYYRSNGGNVVKEFGSYEAAFDWGKIVPIFHADQKQISLTVYINI